MNTHKLLIVDDAVTILSLVDNIFKSRYEVSKCKSVTEAIAYLQHNTPDMIITDLNMPGGGGEELVSHIKSSSELEYIPVVVLSSSENASTRIKLLKMGVDDFVQKPFNPEELSLRVDNILKRCASSAVKY
jgi:DNA-binding response OmpR family regulator